MLEAMFRFAWLEAQSCVFAFGVFVGLAVAYVVPLPVARYDALLVWCLLLTFGFWAIGLESWREVLVIFAFHALGLALELFKVHQGSWLYPGDAVTMVARVPLFSGFMYAAVGSYLVRVHRLFDLGFTRYPRRWLTVVVAAAIYANFFTHHAIVDLRWVLLAAVVLLWWPTVMHFRVWRRTFRMPLLVAFALVALFIWFAENIATWAGAWFYPDQADGWQPVSIS